MTHLDSLRVPVPSNTENQIAYTGDSRQIHRMILDPVMFLAEL